MFQVRLQQDCLRDRGLKQRAEFAAVSSSTVDTACFLGSWLEGTYLWDYELPAYSGRAGDSNGYYLLSKIKELDLETLKLVIKRFPGCDDMAEAALAEIVEEVARRGIPTVRGLAAGDSGATGDLGLLIATRLLQDSFRVSGSSSGLLAPWTKVGEEDEIALVIPVDPSGPSNRRCTWVHVANANTSANP